MTEICATIGPGSKEIATMSAIFSAGAQILRFNFGNGFPPERIVERIADARAACAALGGSHRVKILCDIPHPRRKIRLGSFDPSRHVVVGEQLVLQPGHESPDAGRFLPVNTPDLGFIDDGACITVGDGEVAIEVQSAEPDIVHALALNAGEIRSERGLASALGGAFVVAAPPPSDRFIHLLQQAAPDYLACSFVESADDCAELGSYFSGIDTAVLMPKIESRGGVANLAAIFNAADAVMIARGDLGVHGAFWNVGVTQLTALALARETRKSVFVATHILESMTTQLVPNRAEIADLTSLVVQGAAAVVLARETANGRYPAAATAAAARVVAAANGWLSENA